MSTVIIKVENLGKLYRLGELGTGTISHDLNRWWARIRGKQDPFSCIGEANDRTAKGKSEYVWALKEINFEVQQGEVLGIIGRNGAGKSTLLKILSKVTAPTTGSIKVRGRIASLLEVGTGFHPELTGRENIHLNGAILGMTRKEIQSKFDAIVDFAGVERYIDTPVKRYSSGMYVRLAFAVAAFLEPEILIVDEVLAVGDSEFQKKCLGRMKDVSEKEGRTVLFVSHNMGAILNLCNRSVLFANGLLVQQDDTSRVVSNYLQSAVRQQSKSIEACRQRSGNQKVIFSDFHCSIEDRKVDIVMTGFTIAFVFVLKVNDLDFRRANVGFSLHDQFEDMLVVHYSGYQDYWHQNDGKEYQTVQFEFKNFNLAPGQYTVKGRIEVDGLESDWPKEELGMLHVEMGNFYGTGSGGHVHTATKMLVSGVWS